MSTFYVKTNDNLVEMVAYLKNADGTYINLTTATQVHVHIGVAGGGVSDLITDGVCTVVTPLEGKVRYWVTAADTAHDANEYDLEFEARWGDGTILTIPSKGNAVFKLGDEVG